MSGSGAVPAVTGVHHISHTVSDVEASATWYARVLGMDMVEPRSGVMIGLHPYQANLGDGFDERRNGLDHISFAVAERADLDDWVEWLDEQGVEHSGVRDLSSPISFATVVFRDPDNIQLEFTHLST